MTKEALYNTYRPSSLEEVAGQESTVRILQAQIDANTLPHSLIFFGERGVGKTSVARIIAKMFNKHSTGTREIDAAHDRKVEMIRQLIPTLDYQVMEGDFLTVIFDEAHQMTNDAFQALQKVVEEPPADVRFIFVTTRIDKIPDTIIDRSQRHHFSKVKPEVIFQRLKEVSEKEYEGKVVDELLHYAVKMSDGSLRGALVALGEIASLVEIDVNPDEIAESLGILGDHRISRFLSLYLLQVGQNKPDLKSLLEASSMFESDKVDSFRAFSDFQQYIIDCLYYVKDTKSLPYLKSNVSLLLSSLPNYDLGKFEKNLWDAYKLSLVYEKYLGGPGNNSKIFRGYLLELVGNAS